ncbi:MAG: P-type conjugative transfer protein TrbG [Cardiobacteriaceae bacterium]|nr:P-type conjugative transfer protein TrbG [Cardiobacteriaceae bacterium]
MRALKILSILPLLALADLTLADGSNYIVPDVANADVTNAPLPLLSAETPLSERDHAAMKYASQWLHGNRYPYRDGDRVVYLYGSGQPTLVCAPLELCVIYLQAGEHVVDNGVHLGDTVRWQVAPAIGADDRTQLVFKPVDSGLKTSLVIITDRRTYHIKLVSRRNDYMPGIAFKYPNSEMAAWQEYHKQVNENKAHNAKDGVALADLDFNYHISGCNSCDFRPARVYNDGLQTIIEMPHTMRHSDAPALLVSSAQGDQLVNYRLHDGKYIVDRLFTEAVLVRGVGRKQERVKISKGER